MARTDPHSFADDAQPRVSSFTWRATVDFTRRELDCEVDLALSGEGPVLDLDSRGLRIASVTAAGRAVPFTLWPAEPVLGERLSLALPPGTRALTIAYTTSSEASALQWLEPAQTLGGAAPFLFSQCQAIHARSVVPLQDTPAHRVPWRAEVRVPRALKVVMAAAPVARREEGEVAIETWEMPQPVPPYLFAFAVGDLASRDLSPRSRVWAEPGLVDAAAAEFADVEQMLQAAEALFGPYDWERFDLLTMPPSFPYGGMENPRLTFVTPALVVGDRSLVDVVAHELAHSWTGNLVTNANAEHFWLNEGFTVYAERRIIEALWGPERMALSAALGRRELDDAVARFAATPALTRLRTPLSGVDPDEAFSQVPYEKGFLLLALIEQRAGRARFDAALKAYLRAHRFGAVTTDQFVAFFERALPGVLEGVDAASWIDGEGVPANAPAFHSARLSAIEALGDEAPTAEVCAGWSATEWVLWLDRLPRPQSAERLAELDARFTLTGSRNPEIAVAWLQVAVASGWPAVLPRLEALLGSYGRMKYLRPLYAALMASPALRPVARDLFARFRSRYHPIARALVARLVA